MVGTQLKSEVVMHVDHLPNSIVALVAIVLVTPVARAADPQPAAPLRVCILSGCPTYNSEKSLPPFQKWLESNYQVTCDRLVRKADDDLPGLEKLDNCD